ncbi:uncharacterized protein N7483_010260 [Penicillium malachiteum]|uniref:uncharacterized protein n=1 Tax=Penicillium malachiteum TaxID=1324776 RepID=UPI002546AA5D|nr:uncharacterized protein N7483_010260 [Penicillium malachiteum]KAJ5713079.1 hypothetical protein N7483_010260 [Penicillium malachiteum]
MPKNPQFAYEAKQPAFLQKLRGQYGSDTSGRLEQPALRPRKAKDPKDEEEDEPVYIDEESNEVISKEEYKALAQGETTKEEDGTSKGPTLAEEGQTQGESSVKQSNLTEVGGQRKRKQAKVVGEEENKAEPEETPKATEKPKKSKKGKKIKLSFDDE